MHGLRQLPNILSSFRLIAVPFVFICPVAWRLPFLLVAAVTDFLDGYLARKWKATSRFGTLVDPLGDKGLAIAFACLFWSEGAFSFSELLLFFSREWALIIFVACALSQGYWKYWKIQSFWCGKVATTIQGGIAAFLCCGVPAPTVLYVLMAASGVLAVPELLFRMHKMRLQSSSL